MNIDILLKYFPKLTADQQRQYEALYDLYSDWNAKINVISRKDIENLYTLEPVADSPAFHLPSCSPNVVSR